PAAKAGGLGKPGASLARLDIEASGPLYIADVAGIIINGLVILLAGERREGDGPDQFFMMIAQDAKEVHHLPIDIVVGFDRGGAAIDKHRARAGERFTVMMARGQEREEPI